MGEQSLLVLVLVPTYNERDTIPLLLERLRVSAPDVQVLVIDDNSPDGTGRVVEALSAGDPKVALLERASKDGLGAAYRAGYAEALLGEADIVCQMDADLSHDPAALPALVEAVVEGADLAIGSRYVPGGNVRGWSWHRVLLSRAANVFVRAVTGCAVMDATAGFRAYRRSTLDRLGVERTTSDGYAFQIEMTLRARQEGLEIAEVPIAFVERTHGHSKLSSGVAREALVSVARWGWLLRRGRRL